MHDFKPIFAWTRFIADNLVPLYLDVTLDLRRLREGSKDNSKRKMIRTRTHRFIRILHVI